MTKFRGEKGQAVPILVIALSLVLVGGMGLAIDVGNLYQQTQRAQSAADAAATAAMLSIYKGVNGAGSAAFGTGASFDCSNSSADSKLPCQYAAMNGFGGIASDTVTVSFPTCTGSPDPCGYQSKLSTTISPNQVQVTIKRNTRNSIIKMLGGGDTSLVNATAVAAVVEVESPTPIIITHPTLAKSLDLNGTTTLQICGGPSRSIQVNSSNAQAFNPSNGTIDLTKAGPSGNANCTANAGADFQVLGGDPTNPGEVLLGTGKYRSREGPIPDPFLKVVQKGYFGYTTDSNPPPRPAAVAPAPTPVAFGTGSCTNPAATGGCYLFHPGVYNSPTYVHGIKARDYGSGSTTYVLFEPGLYYVESTAGVDFTQATGGNMTDYNGLALNDNVMCTTPPPGSPTMCQADTYTGNGMLIYNTGPAGNSANSGTFNIGTQANVVFTGPTLTTTNAAGDVVPGPPYYNIVFWQDRNSQAHTGANKHVMGTGAGCFTLNKASLYITNTRDTMLATASHYQALDYAGTPCSGTLNQGLIIVSTLTIKGGSTIIMNLEPSGFLYLDQVALVAGGPHP